MIDKFSFLQETVFEEIHNWEEEFESPAITLWALNKYLYELSKALDMRDKGLTYRSGQQQSLPDFPTVFDRY
jgi:hypothetical protein